MTYPRLLRALQRLIYGAASHGGAAPVAWCFMLLVSSPNWVHAQSVDYSIADTTIWAGERIAFIVSAKNSAGVGVPAEVVEMPPGATFNEFRGEYTWTPGEPQIGRFAFKPEGAGTGTVSDLIVVALGTLFRDDPDLIGALRQNYGPSLTLTRDQVEDSLFVLFVGDDRLVEGLYTGHTAKLADGDPSTVMADSGLAVEHLWPESMLGLDSPLGRDLYNLAPVTETANSARLDKRFATISDGEVEFWYRSQEVLQTPPPEARGTYSRSTPGRWTPRDLVLGDVARAVQYATLMYADDPTGNAHFLQTASIQPWTYIDPPSMAEYRRALRIQAWQGNVNPFLLDPNLHLQVFGLPDLSNEDDPELAGFSVYPNPAATVLQVDSSVHRSPGGILVLYDHLGRRVRTATHFGSTLIDVGGLSPGLYFAVLETEGARSIKPVVVVR